MTRNAFTETWSLSKPAVSSKSGVVVTQHHRASEVGAAVLRSGGNAMDAAVAAGFALGTVEPWMSGIGGCGNLLYFDARESTCHAVSFGVRAPWSLDTDDYPLAGGHASDLFAWPAVVEDRNVFGPRSVAVPGYVAGVSRALERFGTISFADALAPAIDMAHAGMDVDWYASLKIASSAAALNQFEPARSIYLDNGQAPIGEWGGSLPHIELKGLAKTLEHLAQHGPEDFYQGELARRIVADAEKADIKLELRDLCDYYVTESEALRYGYGDAVVSSVPGMTAGPTMNHALELLGNSGSQATGNTPGDDRYSAMADALYRAYEHRLSHLGDANETTSPSCTTHVSVVDQHGNVVALTQTLLSLFGSKVVMPDTGILMNNGIMWFDPRPDRANSMAPGRWPLSNMCPAIVEHGTRRFALGASGGRRIMPSVFQILSFLVDHGMSLEEAAHHPRIDVSGSNELTIDNRLDAGILNSFENCNVVSAPNGVYPALFACPNLAAFDVATKTCEGAAFVASPSALALAG